MERLDVELQRRGLAASRERARALIMGGKVLIEGQPATKAGTKVDPDADISLKAEDHPFVSRGGVKLEAAMKQFEIEASGKTALDAGASTGGFTDCLLKRGAARVYAVDVGYGQLDWSLRNDPRVVVLERRNIRHLGLEELGGEKPALGVVDVSFISLRLVLPKLRELLGPPCEVVALVKPQFEVGKGEVGKGGVVRDEEKRLAALEAVAEGARASGFTVVGHMESPIKGPKGNVEYLLYLKG